MNQLAVTTAEYKPATINLINSYPTDKYNLIVGMQTMTEISPLHRISVNLVSIDLARDVYPQSNKLALNKVGLSKIMGAANIQVLQYKVITTTTCSKCKEHAQAIRSPLQCGSCPSKDDIAIQAAISIPDFAGGARIVTATREWISEEEKASSLDKNGNYSDKLFKQKRLFRKPLTETKALLRAARQALSIQATYTADELKKPFVVPVVNLNYSDPDLKAAAIKRFADGSDLIFGKAAIESPSALSLDSGIGIEDEMQLPPIPDDIGMSDLPGGEQVDADFSVFDDNPEMNDAPDSRTNECHECGSIIEKFVSKSSGREWAAEKWISYAVHKTGAQLCPKCFANRMKGAA